MKKVIQTKKGFQNQVAQIIQTVCIVSDHLGLSKSKNWKLEKATPTMFIFLKQFDNEIPEEIIDTFNTVICTLDDIPEYVKLPLIPIFTTSKEVMDFVNGEHLIDTGEEIPQN